MPGQRAGSSLVIGPIPSPTNIPGMADLTGPVNGFTGNDSRSHWLLSLLLADEVDAE